MNKISQTIIWVLLSIFFLFSRLINSNELPLFSDEAYVLIRAGDIWQTGNLLTMVKLTTQPIFIWVVALFIKLPLYNVFAGRLVNTIFGLITALLIARMAGKYIHPDAKWLTFLLMIVLPFPFFYDRTLLFESILLTWMTLAMILPYLGLPLAILTKQTGWLAVPLIVLLHRNNRKLLFISLSIALVIPLVVWLIALGNWEQIVKVNFLQTATPIGTSANLKVNLLRAKLWLINYITLPILFLATLGLLKEFVLYAKKRVVSPILLIGLWSLALLLFEAKVAVIFYPRYLYPMIPGIVFLATSAGWMLITYLKSFKGPFFRFSVLLISLSVLFYPSIRFNYTLMNSPRQAPLALEDRLQFFQDWTSGVGSEKFNEEINKFNQSNRGKLILYVEGENSYYVTLNRSDMQNYEIRIASWLNDPLTNIPQSVLQENAEVWFIRNRHPDIPKYWPVTLIALEQKSSSRNVYLYRIIK